MSNPDPPPPSTSPRKLKILMLHGYTQSGPLFHAKTRALEKALHKAFPPHPTNPSSSPLPLPSYPGGIALFYPSAPHTLSANEIPGYTPASETSSSDHDWRAWWRRDSTTGEYTGLEEGLKTVADVARSEGGVDGVVGFSQGGCCAAFVASLLEEGRREAFAAKEGQDWGTTFPKTFLEESGEEAISSGKELKFAVSYSGFYAPDKRYRAFYDPKIRTPTMHFIGSLDTVVEEERSSGLVERCVEAKVCVHPGGHFVPVSKEWVNALIGFIKETCGENADHKDGDASDIDVPF